MQTQVANFPRKNDAVRWEASELRVTTAAESCAAAQRVGGVANAGRKRDNSGNVGTVRRQFGVLEIKSRFQASRAGEMGVE